MVDFGGQLGTKNPTKSVPNRSEGSSKTCSKKYTKKGGPGRPESHRKIGANHNQERISLFAEIIKEIPEVIECYRMSGETDYLLKVVVKDIESYDNFYKNLIEKVQFLKVTSNFAIEEIKSTTEIPLTAMEKIA